MVQAIIEIVGGILLDVLLSFFWWILLFPVIWLVSLPIICLVALFSPGRFTDNFSNMHGNLIQFWLDNRWWI